MLICFSVSILYTSPARGLRDGMFSQNPHGQSMAMLDNAGHVSRLISNRCSHVLPV